ncbi:MAG: acetyl-CoA carboxylase biotin carboxyl carrier protein subunit [Gammaproteobacteria bacterium]|nr:acetyl-CoA carboxylase biotin carboxyl carrier protein subunit [Gammaproteobacteria bacterium]
MPTLLTLDGTTSEVDIIGRRPQLNLRVDDLHCRVEELPSGGASPCDITINGQRHRVWRAREGDRIHVHLDGRSYSVGYQEAVRAAAQSGHASNEIRAEMPGMVVELRAALGDDVAAGDPLLVIESMKMQITVTAPRAGVIESIHVEPNTSFQKGTLLVLLRAVVE